MGSKKPKQICPFLSNYQIADHGDYYPGDINCQGDRCALWDTWFDECGILSIAHALGRKRMEDDLERKKHLIPNIREA